MSVYYEEEYVALPRRRQNLQQAKMYELDFAAIFHKESFSRTTEGFLLVVDLPSTIYCCGWWQTKQALKNVAFRLDFRCFECRVAYRSLLVQHEH